MTGRFGVLCGEDLTREMAAVVAAGEFPDIVTGTFSGHNGIEGPLQEMRETCDRICILWCGDGTELPALPDLPPFVTACDVMRGVLLPDPLFDARVQEGALVAVPGMLSRWKGHAAATESAKIVLVDTGVDPESSRLLAALSDELRIPTERIPVGIEPLRRCIALGYQEWRADAERKTLRDALAEANRKSADYAMIIDLLGNFTELQNEETVVEEMLNLFTILFGPERIGFASVDEERLGRIVSRPPGYYEGSEQGMACFAESCRSTERRGENGFSIDIRNKGRCLGILLLEGVPIPERIDEYIDISRFVVGVCGLAISNARTCRKIQETVRERDEKIGEQMRVEKALREANKKLNTLSSITRHDVLNQLAALLGYLEITQMDLEAGRLSVDPVLVRYIANELQAAKTIQRQIEFTRYYQDIGVREAEWHDTEALIQQAVGELPLSKVRVDVGVAGLRVYADPLIEKVFYNLMENSIRHGGGISRISVSSSVVPDGLVIAYTDDGMGIPSVDKGEIFRKGFGKNTGFGLFLAREILAITGITIQETGVEGEGARFEMLVPRGGYRFVEESQTEPGVRMTHG